MTRQNRMRRTPATDAGTPTARLRKISSSVVEELHLLEQSGRRRDELIQQMLQAVAVMQADIVRIDETHS